MTRDPEAVVELAAGNAPAAGAHPPSLPMRASEAALEAARRMLAGAGPDPTSELHGGPRVALHGLREALGADLIGAHGKR